MDNMLVVSGVLLVLMLVLLASGLWIAMTLAFCGWVGQAFFIDTQPGKNLFSAFWESKAMLGALALAGWSRSLTWPRFKDGLMGATRTSCMIMFILAGAAFLTKTMAFTGIPRALAEWVTAMQLSPFALIAAMTVVYLVRGTALDGISMIVLTSAVVLPMIQKAGFDLVWFGIFIVLLVEIAELTPPAGINLFVLQNMTGKDSNTIARAALPFFACLVLCIGLITVFPAIVTWLPDRVMGVER